jgi:uncharacterized protein
LSDSNTAKSTASGEQVSLLDTVLQRLLVLLPNPQKVDWDIHTAAVWRVSKWHGSFVAHADVDDVRLQDLLHVEDQRDQLMANTEQLLAGLPANNVLMWGARGTGKSSLIHALLNAYATQGLRLVEVHREELGDLADVVAHLAELPYKFVVFCDDLSFEVDDPSYKALKSALEGSIFKTARNVLIYATSNRRHLVPEHMVDNQNMRVTEGELHETEAVEEKISLSDRFGLWLSFYPFRQDAYLEIVSHWVANLAAEHGLNLDLEDEELRLSALRWALARGVRNGRTAQYFARHWVGQQALSQKSR